MVENGVKIASFARRKKENRPGSKIDFLLNGLSPSLCGEFRKTVEWGGDTKHEMLRLPSFYRQETKLREGNVFYRRLSVHRGVPCDHYR